MRTTRHTLRAFYKEPIPYITAFESWHNLADNHSYRPLAKRNII